MPDAPKLAVLATGYVAGANSQWGFLVDLACSLSPDRLDRAAQVLAKRTNVSKDSLKRKMEAIHRAQAKGIEAEALKAIGQEKILSDYVKAKKSERVEGLATLSYRMAPDLKEAVQKQLVRVARVLKLTTSDQVFEFLNSVMQEWTPEEIRHAAGDGHTENKDTAPR
jgi:hypothetical protein